MSNIIPFDSVSDVLSSILVFGGGGLLGLYVGIKTRVSPVRVLVLYCLHTFWCAVYLWYLLKNGGDAIGYYNNALLGSWDMKLGGVTVSLVTYFLVYALDLSIAGAFLFFNVLGFLGLLLFYSGLKEFLRDASFLANKLAFFVVLLPSISFWSSAIGKDAISFLSAGIMVWSLVDIKKRMLGLVLGVLILFMVRPHMSLIAIFSLGFSYVMSASLSIQRRAAIASISFLIFLSILPYVLNYVGLNEEGVGGVREYVEARQGYNMGGGSSVDISSMSLPFQMITYVYRPAIIEVRSLFDFAAAIDNLVISFVTIMGFRFFLRLKSVFHDQSTAFMVCYVSLSWVALSMTTANLGIALRQKWMFLPMLIVLLLVSFKKDERLGRGV